MKYQITTFDLSWPLLNTQCLIRADVNSWSALSTRGFEYWNPTERPGRIIVAEFDSIEEVLEYKDLGVDLRARIIRHLL